MVLPIDMTGWQLLKCREKSMILVPEMSKYKCIAAILYSWLCFSPGSLYTPCNCWFFSTQFTAVQAVHLAPHTFWRMVLYTGTAQVHAMPLFNLTYFAVWTSLKTAWQVPRLIFSWSGLEDSRRPPKSPFRLECRIFISWTKFTACCCSSNF